MADVTMPVAAYLTTDEEGSPAMLFFDKVVAATYCDEGEEPQALVLKSDALKAIEEARVPTYTMDDVHTLIGHAVFLKGEGQTDMPAYFFDLAARLADHLDPAYGQKLRSLKESP